MKKIRIIRITKGKNSTLSHLYFEQRFLSYLLEDRMSTKKEAGLTCIPDGNYELCLNTTAPMNVRYQQRFPTLHKGMLEVTGIPNFKGVFLHIGNNFKDTKGCPLTGHYWLKAGEDFQVCQSAFAYLQVYPILLSVLRKEGKCSLSVIDQTEGDMIWT
nr:hypothetical protein [Pseudopedobacter sp.]